MKLQLIMLDNPIVVSDEKGSMGYNYNFGLQRIDKLPQFYDEFSTEGQFCRKIIAGIPELHSIDFSALSDEDCKRIGWVDVEKLAKYHYGENRKTREFEDGFMLAFDIAFKTAQSLNDKKFTEEDVIKAAKYGYEFRDTTSFPEHKFEDSCINNFKQNLEYLKYQPKVFDIEVEMEVYDNKDTCDRCVCTASLCMCIEGGKSRPKIANNSIKITKIL